MDDEVDEMVAVYFGSSKIVIEGKTEACCRPEKFSGPVPVCKKSFFDLLCIYFGQVQGFIVENVVFVVKMPRCIKGVGIDAQYEEKQGNKGKNVFPACCQ